MATATLGDRCLRTRRRATYTLGDHPIADQARSLDVGEKAVPYIYGPRLQSSLYPGEKRLPR